MRDNDNQPLSEGERRRTPDRPPPPPSRNRVTLGSARKVPVLRLLLFYAVLIGLATLIMNYVPLARHAWVESPAIPSGESFSKDVLARAVQEPLNYRALSVLLITLGALALSLPLAWVYTFTRRLRYDPSLVHSVIILPMVVSGIVVIVKDSIALAFGLAGIVAVVRFRNTLKDPKDAVYIFLALGLGLAAGVQALDIALVMSAVFNAVVLTLWKYNFAAIYRETNRDLLAVGDRTVMIARNAAQSDAIRWRISRRNPEIDFDGILLVHAREPEIAKQRVELTLAKFAEAWQIAENFRRRNGVSTFAVMVELKDKKSDPLMLLAEVEERWMYDILAAEYLPFRKSSKKAKKKDKQKDAKV